MKKLIILSLAITVVTCGVRLAVSDSGLAGMDLVEALRDGGFNIYLRHAQTDWAQRDHVNAFGDWTSCDPTKMRQLSASGRRTSKAIGDAMRTLRIPVSRVLASPYCRTMETATLLGLGPVEVSTDIMNLRSADYFSGRKAVLSQARSRLAEAPPPGTNIVLVGHGNVAREATPVYPDEAEAALFRPDGDGSFKFIGRLTLEQWLELVKMAKSVPQTE